MKKKDDDLFRKHLEHDAEHDGYMPLARNPYPVPVARLRALLKENTYTLWFLTILQLLDLFWLWQGIQANQLVIYVANGMLFLVTFTLFGQASLVRYKVLAMLEDR